MCVRIAIEQDLQQTYLLRQQHISYYAMRASWYGTNTAELPKQANASAVVQHNDGERIPNSVRAFDRLEARQQQQQRVM